MNKTWTLTKILLKNGSGGLSKTGRSGKLPLRILLPVLLVIAFLPLVSAFSRFVGYLYDSLALVGQSGVIPAIGFAAACTVIFIFGIVYVINMFFFAQDVEHLLPLPLTPAQILSAKFAVTLLYEYLTSALILGPLLITYGVKSGGGVLYYITAALLFLAIPVIPLVLASVLAMAVMRFSNISKNKDRYRTIGGSLAVLFALGFNLFIQRQTNSRFTQEDLQNMFLPGSNGLVDFATRTFPSAKLAAEALLRQGSMSGLAYLLLFLGLSGLVYAIFLLLGERFYFSSVMGLSESSSRRERLTGEQLDKHSAPRSALQAYLSKEFRILLRTPPFFLNCVLMSVLWPVILSIPILSRPDMTQFVQSAGGFAQGSGRQALVLAGGFALFLFVSGSNATASTSISREGTGFFVNKYVPVPYGTILLAKVISGWTLSMVSVVLLLVMALVLIGLPPMLCALLFLVAVPGTLFLALTGVLIDLIHPKLNWDNEQKAVKQNLNSLYNMLAGVITAAIFIFAVIKFHLGLYTAFAVILLVMAAADLLLYRLLMTKGQSRMQHME